MNNTIYFDEFKNNIIEINNINKTSYSLKLLYANVITLMEAYLYSSFIDIIQRENLHKKIFKTNMYKSESIKFTTIDSLDNFDIKKHIIDELLKKKLLFHKLPNINTLFKEVLDIKVNINEKIMKAIENRHHIIHRNGKDFDGNNILISENDLNELINIIENFLKDIDNKIYNKYFI